MKLDYPIMITLNETDASCPVGGLLPRFLAAKNSGDHNEAFDYPEVDSDAHDNKKEKPEPCNSVIRPAPCPADNKTIEQLSAEYRNIKNYAWRLQKEADDAKAAEEAKISELVEAGAAAGIAISFLVT